MDLKVRQASDFGLFKLSCLHKQHQPMILVYKFLKESFLFAINALRTNVLRTILTLSGVTIGIFSIITVFTLIDFLEKQVRESIESLGDNVVYIQKWPWTPPEGESEYPWWRYMNRQVPSLDDYEQIKRRSQIAEDVSYVMSSQKMLQYESNSYDNVAVMGVSDGFDKIWTFEIAGGRYFSPYEANSGMGVAIIGAEIASELFQGTDPIGKRVKMMGRKLTVIGVLLRTGSDIFGNSLDKNIIIPVKYARNLFNLRSESVNPMILVKAKPGYTSDDMVDELTGVMRAIRRIKPQGDNDFALNRISLIQKNFDSLFDFIDWAGWFIGGFSILVGGFGIANIMFVSVKERTRIIGIQKALGAKRKFILMQFLIESTALSLLGGLAGLFIVFGIAMTISLATDSEMALTLLNILKGIGISSFIGVVSGFIPAWKASKMDPVEAINAL
ncbi:ABC transporter permease [uncultured Carboxylicivirga sp.]|uniref:ABC transporter permease n=2 Tax=Carboxylicivirga marina TaxID=2800988 RepID=A0ABS1HLT4_9BACT|nr:ABC transporter permease [uncultured Carboxylicivirga sp.]MBK3518570.1 ABC transporter permease [Carboxylicivirga marina]